MLSILDVTLRDGGYVNNHQFSLEDCRGIVRHLGAARIPFIEVGYFRTVNENYSGRTGSVVCDSAYLQAMREESGDSQLAVMVRLGDIRPEHIGRLADSGVRMVRFPVQAGSLDEVTPYIEAARRHNLLTAVNVIRASELTLADILRCGAFIEEIGVDWLYIADSNGSMMPFEVAEIFTALSESVKIDLALHPHDGLSLAFANALEAIRAGAQLIDTSLGGMGKNGNLCTELVAMYFNVKGTTAYDVRSLTDATRLFIAKTLGEGCILRNEYAAASVLNLNLDKLGEITKTSRRNGRLVLDLLLEEVQTRALEAKEEDNGSDKRRISRHPRPNDSRSQEDDQSVVPNHFSRQSA